MPKPHRAGRFEKNLEFETLLSDLSSRFINLQPGELDREIEDALRRVCELLGIDLAILWQWSVATPDVIVPTHSHCYQEELRSSEPMRQEHYPWARQQMLAGATIVVSRLEDLPAEARVDRETCRSFGIKSVLCLPLAVGGEPPVGALGFNTLRAELDWPDMLVKRLRLIAQVFTNALARNRHELNQQASMERLAVGSELAGLAFYEVDFNEGVMYFEDPLRDIFGVPPEREQGLQALQFWMEHLHPADRPRVLEVREQLHDGRLGQASLEYRFLHPTDGEKWIHHEGRISLRDASGRAVKSHGVFRDITARKRTEDELLDLSSRLIRAHEEERALLARELHDDVTQRLAVLAIEVGRAESTAPDATHAEAMRSVRAGLVCLSEDVHSLAYQLHPSVLAELGLTEALRTECERIERRCRVDLAVVLDPLPVGIGKDAALCLFRVTQEALNNMTRHAAAGAATVTLRQKDGGLLLSVADDGVGFDPRSPRACASLGLASMRERVRLVNGTFDIESAPGRGTAIIAWVPAAGEVR